MILWRRRPDRPPVDPQPLDDATEALEQAMGRWPAVNATVSEMRRMRERNHFAETFRHALKGD